MEEIARAKVNLALHVRGREADGYHRIETLFAFCEDGDRLRGEPAETLSLIVEGRFAGALAGEGDNLVHRGARLLAKRYAVTVGAVLTLEKNLPVAAGIGGGSADAAAALRLLNRIWSLGLAEADMLPIAAELGADVPACLLSRTARGEGRGDALTDAHVPGLTGAPVLLVNPCVAVSTADIFRRWNGTDGGPLPSDPWQGRNDLEAPAREVAPVIGDVLDALAGAKLARMSGSGATCFAVYADAAQRDRAATRIAAAHPGWWAMLSRFR